jgi:multiple sugar transport system permease protein
MTTKSDEATKRRSDVGKDEGRPVSVSPPPSLRRFVASSLLYALLLAVALTMLLPLWWMIVTAISGPDAILNGKVTLWPSDVHFENFARVVRELPFVRFYVNTIVVAVAITAGQVLTSAMAAYAFARLRFPARDRIFFLYLATLMIPGAVTMIPVFILVVRLGWYDNLLALIVPGIFSAFGTFLLRQFFLTIPRELEEAARLDGCSLPQVFWHVILPLSRPALATLAIFTFLGAWKSFLWPLVVTVSDEKKVLSVGVASYQGLHNTQWNLLMAASLMMLLPVIGVFIAGQRQFIAGLQIGAVKG